MQAWSKAVGPSSGALISLYMRRHMEQSVASLDVAIGTAMQLALSCHAWGADVYLHPHSSESQIPMPGLLPSAA
jgi:hypothetical protein